MGDYENEYTIEYNGSKGWDILYHSDSLTDTVNRFRALVLTDGDLVQYRLTTPKP